MWLIQLGWGVKLLEPRAPARRIAAQTMQLLSGSSLAAPLRRAASIRGHTISGVWLWLSVVSLVISVTTDASSTGGLLVT